MRNTYLQMCDYGSRFRILKGGKISLVVSAFIASVTMLHAAPSGGVVTAGSASIAQSGSVTNITQSTQKAAINWQNFSIGTSETVNFNQPSVSSVTLNRVIGNEKSIIDGALNANGQVFILNSNGVLFSKNASINTAGLVATTMNLSDTDFMDGNYNFKGDSSASIINQGTITISDKGFAALFGKEVKNEGIIKATLGKVELVGASEVTLNLNGNSLVNLTVDKGVLDALVENKGAVLADGGKIYLTTNAVDEILKGVVNNTGLIEANSLDDISGEVVLFAHGGTAKIGGTIEAVGGFVETSGEKLSIKDGTIIKAKDWLLDPTNITIASSGTEPISGTPDATTTTPGDVTISASTIETTLNNGTSVALEADNDINVNDAINITKNGLYLTAGNDININANINVHTDQYYGLSLMAGNDINVNAIIDVRSQNILGIFYGFDGVSAFNTTSHLNMGMNADKTAFTGKINLASDSTIYMNNLATQSTIISDATQLASLTTNDDTVRYVLGSDITSGMTDWTPIGFFTGKFDGFGHIIDGMTINDTDASSWDKGLFSQVRYGSVSNLALTNVDVKGLGNQYGALAGWMRDATISNIILQGSVKGDKDASYGYFGGLTGYARDTTIDNVHANVDVEGSSYVGGLVGYGTGALTIINSSSHGDIKFASEGAGGLVGYFDTGDLIIEKSFNAGSIGAMADTTGYSLQEVGGLVGYLDSYSDGYIKESFNMGSVAGTNSVGGIVGYISQIPEITNTFNIGTVTAIGNTASGIGGFIGTVDSDVEITNSYNSGNVLKTATSSENVGGFIGSVESSSEVSIKNSFSGGDVTGTTSVGGFIGRLTRGDYVELENVSASGTVNGTTNVGGFIGQSGEVETEKIELDLNNVNWSSTASGQANAIGSSFAPTLFVRLYDTDEEKSVYVSPNVDNAGGRYTTDVLGEDPRVAYNKGTHYDALVTNDADGEYHKTLGTIKTGDFTDSANITTAQNSIIASAFTAPTWIIVNGLPTLAWSEVASSEDSGGGSTPPPTPSPTQDITPIITQIVNGAAVAPRVPNFTPPTPPAQAPQVFNFGGAPVALMSTPMSGTPTQMVSMQEVRQMLQGGSNEIRIPLMAGSLIDLINGGVRLPEGVYQEFFMAQR